MVPLIAYGAEAIHNRPRYVSFARPTALTLNEVDISDLGNSGSGDGAGNDSGSDTSNDSGSSSSNSDSNGSGSDGSESGGGSEPAEAPSQGAVRSPAEVPKTAMVRSPAVIPKPEKKRSPVVQIKRLEAIQMKVRTKPRNLQKKPKNPKEADENGSHSGGAGGNRPAGPDVPESTEAELETLPAEVLSKPEDEKEAREPEDFYDDLIEEPEGELVQFNDRYRTYQTGDGEYITVVGGYSGLYQDKSGEALEANNMLTEADVEDEEISVATGSNARRMRSMVSAGTTCRNENGPMTVLLPEKMSGGRGYTITKGGDSLEIIPEGGDYTLSCVGDNAIRYSDVYENVDVQYTILNGTVKEDIILLEKQERTVFLTSLSPEALNSRKKVIRLSPITQRQRSSVPFDGSYDGRCGRVRY
ncbi:MAG: hypothetical protein ACLR0U_31520 [Enterocloster clostridioformis]